MNCKSCNTRIPTGLRTCPNCGRIVSNSTTQQQGSSQTSATERQRLSGSRAGEDVELDLDLELDEEIEEIEASEAVPPPPQRSSAGRTARPRPQPARPERSAPAPASRKGAPTTPSPNEIRAMAVDDPGVIEPGLEMVEHGAGYPTDVGDIDLLAEDEAGGLVIVMVALPNEGKDIVSELLQRIGWVRKNAAKAGQEVRAIALLESFPDEVAYAAAAVADTIQFKTYRVSLCFEDVAV